MKYCSARISSVLLFYGNRPSTYSLPFILQSLAKIQKSELRILCPVYINTGDEPTH